MTDTEEVEELTVEKLAFILYELGEKIDKDREEVAVIIERAAQEIYNSVQEQVEANERIIAQILPAYQELSLAVEVIVWKLWGDSIEESEDFKAKLSAARNNMVDWLRNATRMQVDERDLAESLGKLFPTKSPHGQGTNSNPADDISG